MLNTKNGSKALLSEDLDKKLQVYLTKLREAVLARIVSGGFRNLERGVQLLAREAQLEILGLPHPLPVT